MTNEYKHWSVERNNQGTNKFTIIAFETFGVIIQDDVKGVISQFIHEKENRGSVLTLAMQQLSVAFHTIRAKQFVDIKCKGIVTRE